MSAVDLQVRTVQVNGYATHIPADQADAGERLLFGNVFECPKLPGEPDVRRVLDADAGFGAFAIWAVHRWAYAWIDCFAPTELERALVEVNAPMGARVAGRCDLKIAERYDVVHFHAKRGVDWAAKFEPWCLVVEDRVDLSALTAGAAIAWGYTPVHIDLRGCDVVTVFCRVTRGEA
ncbi:MAG TPA: hypothetical protein VF287_06865 [Usitatibacter sp.]